jgi:cysteine-rich repeat protein
MMGGDAGADGGGTDGGDGGMMPVCGDGIVDGTEQCDDGNTMNGDGCSSTCHIENGFLCSGMPSHCTCTMNAFIDCSGMSAVYCNAAGNGTMSFPCGAGGCIGGVGKTGCGQCTSNTCTPGTPSTFMTCNTMHDLIISIGNCLTLAAGPNQSLCNGTVCQECTGMAVCGDGMSYGTVKGMSYACDNGVLGAATACPLGCDGTTGKCADLVPSSQAGTQPRRRRGRRRRAPRWGPPRRR